MNQENENTSASIKISDPSEIKKWIEENPEEGICKIWIDALDGTKIPVAPIEVMELRKEILFVFDQSIPAFEEGYILDECFKRSYWQFTRINGDVDFNDEERSFAIEGGLIVTIALVVQFLEPDYEDREIFDENAAEALEYLEAFSSDDPLQQELAQITLFGIQLVITILTSGLSDNDIEELKEDFYDELPWVTQNFIKPYYLKKLEEFTNNPTQEM